MSHARLLKFRQVQIGQKERLWNVRLNNSSVCL